MKIKSLGSGSTGNCYLVKQDGVTYILDAGVDFKKTVSNINLNQVDFAFISHEHKDHSLNQEKLAFRGVKIIDGRNIQVFSKNENKGIFIPNTSIYTFPIEHGECKNAGLIVKTENECLLYCTDFNICRYDLSDFKFTHIIVECNYQEDLMNKAPNDFKRLRQINTHMGLEGLKVFIKHLDLTDVEWILLVHLSTESELIDRDTLGLKAKLEFHKKIGVAKQRGGIDWYGG